MKKILFIEDEAAIQKTLGESLRNKGYDVQAALDGEDGLRLAKSGKPDLILLDLILPKLHGLDVLERIRKDKDIKETPVIILTNLENVGEVERALELGATTYLVKANYSLEDVVAKVKKAMGDR
ncbi:response regulator [Patescibacteria group bacterium]|nr:response regulator [Patescibacteria group bacterium]MBU4023109.1 response regulator [Patescibacteria group bacterium]MBU4078353.1 response regulator [Patescibacteria group bacterium]